MKTKEMKKHVKAKFADDKQARKARKKALSGMKADQRKEAKKNDKASAKQQKKALKQDIKAMSKEDKRIAKKEDKFYKKLKKRPRRRIIWAIIVLLIVWLLVSFGSVIGDFAGLFGGITLESESDEAKAALANGEQVAELISDEGIVLLKNEDNLLPLVDGKVNVFGYN